jgi:Flp pilus assembly protein TadG
MIYIDFFYIIQSVKSWADNEDGIAMMEAAMLFPPLLTLLLGTYDLGNGIVLSQKTITASQVAADLISRNRTMDSANLNDIIAGSKLAFEPFSDADFGIDAVSVQFDENQNPDVIWRETQNMLPNQTALDNTAGSFEEGEGLIIVTVVYSYKPKFAQHFIGEIEFTEVAFARGRRSETITWN